MKSKQNSVLNGTAVAVVVAVLVLAAILLETGRATGCSCPAPIGDAGRSFKHLRPWEICPRSLSGVSVNMVNMTRR